MQSGESATLRHATKTLPTIRSCWAGAGPNVARAFLVNQGDLMTYDNLKNYILMNGWMEECSSLHFICSFGAGLVACLLCLPFDTIKTRIMNQPQNSHGKGMFYGNSMLSVARH